MALPNTPKKMEGGDSPRRHGHSSKEGNGLAKSGTSPSGTSESDDGGWWSRVQHKHRPIVSPPLVYNDLSRRADQHADQRPSADTKDTPGSSTRRKRKLPSHRRRVTFGTTRKRAAVEDGSPSDSAGACSAANSNGERKAEEEEQQPQGDWGSRVPLEVLQVIFAEATRTVGAVPTLVRLSFVCRLWRDAAFSPHLWRSVDLGDHTKESRRTEKKLMWLLENRLTHARDLSLAGWHRVMKPACLSAVCAGCPELRSLSVARCRHVTASLLLLVARQAPRLRALDLSAVEPRGTVSAPTLRQLADVMGSRLTELTLAHNLLTGLPQMVAVLAESCPRLEVLDLSNMVVSSSAAASLPVEKLMLGCRRLRVLCWTNTTIRLGPEPEDEEPAPGFPALEELSVAVLKDTGSGGVDNADLWRLLCSSARLRLLDVRGCTAVTADGLLRLPADNLQHLFLSRSGATAGSQTLYALLERWRHSLLELDLAGGGHQPTVDAALRELAAPCSERWPPPPLRRLDLCGAAGSLPAVQLVVAACPQLRELDLTSCRALPRGLKRLYRGDEVATLRDGEPRRRGGPYR
ncbi:F-box/LRR-repeat protein 6-like [Amphibalanus amphitrite]|uniref:F-box/LRR-repeat protein 6-like n=1 Tax=Amphibalanus amphitrite TaxID=1232801 RepID=UPI001C91525D|nr:F-box/LRR-repeat protein 6-like [Amphibalanus amphitrite]XP_043198132.1 F-box/LRR-repeat protein 6-like [Amphibalanus amphitrite]